MVSIFLSSDVSNTVGVLFLLHPHVKGVTVFDIDTKESFCPFEVSLSNGRVLKVYVPPEHSTKK